MKLRSASERCQWNCLREQIKREQELCGGLKIDDVCGRTGALCTAQQGMQSHYQSVRARCSSPPLSVRMTLSMACLDFCDRICPHFQRRTADFGNCLALQNLGYRFNQKELSRTLPRVLKQVRFRNGHQKFGGNWGFPLCELWAPKLPVFRWVGHTKHIIGHIGGGRFLRVK